MPSETAGEGRQSHSTTRVWSRPWRWTPATTLSERYSYANVIGACSRPSDQLSQLLQTTVVLTSLQGLSYKEAAVVLETTEGTIAWRIHEARKKMSNYLRSLDLSKASIRPRRRSLSDSAVMRLELVFGKLVPRGSQNPKPLA